MKHFEMFAIVLFCCATILLFPVTSNASIFNITIDTTPIQGTSGALAFDFLDGDGLVNNTVTISNFTSDATLSTGVPTGDITGTLSPGPVVLGDGDFFNEWLQDLTFGATLNFQLEITGNGPFTPVPDSFSFFLLDNTLFPYATSDPLGADALLIVDIDNTNPSVQTFVSSSATVVVSAVPLPGALLLFVSGGFGIIGIRWIGRVLMLIKQ